MVVNVPTKYVLCTELADQDAKALADFSSFLPSFLLLTLINHILYDRDVIENLCLFFFKPHNSPFRYMFLGEEVLYYDNR